MCVCLCVCLSVCPEVAYSSSLCTQYGLPQLSLFTLLPFLCSPAGALWLPLTHSLRQTTHTHTRTHRHSISSDWFLFDLLYTLQHYAMRMAFCHLTCNDDSHSICTIRILFSIALNIIADFIKWRLNYIRN